MVGLRILKFAHEAILFFWVALAERSAYTVLVWADRPWVSSLWIVIPNSEAEV